MIQFDTKNQPFRDLMGNHVKYTVPRFQRDYSWGEEQWEDLWQDLHSYSESAQNTKPTHYMGYLVLQSFDGKSFIIIDGQQRLTTISIIILSALYELKKLINEKVQTKDNQKRLDTLRNRFIGFTDPVSLLRENKLTLNRNNDSFFKTYLCSLSVPPVRKLNHSEKLIREALNYFSKKLKEYLSDKAPEEKGKQIAQLIDNTADRLFFTVITVNSEANAYTVFETLNARGVQLSTPDLVKNYIFSLIDSKKQLHDTALENLESKWSNIIHQLGKHKFSDFIRVEWNSKNDFSRANELFKKIKVKLNNEDKASEYLEALQKNSELYSALKDYNDEFWKNHKNGLYNNNKLKLSLKTLNMFNVVAPLSVLISAFHKFSSYDFIKFAHYIEVISVRYNIICGLSPGLQERTYSEIARAITKLPDQSLKKVLPLLKKTYPSDKDFIHAFNIKRFKVRQTNKKVCYLLCRMENFLNPNHNVLSIDLNSISLEHILPVNPTPDWIKEFEHGDDQVEEWLELIGNFTLISQKQNKTIGRKSFKEKKLFFEKSNFIVTKKCAEYNEWNEVSITKHQQWLAEQAKSLWRLPVS